MKKNKFKKIINAILVINFCIWWIAIFIALVMQNARLFFLFFFICIISGVCMGVVVFIPFVNDVNKDVNPVFGKPKNKNLGSKVYGEESNEKQYYDIK